MRFTLNVKTTKYITAEVDSNDLESAKQALRENLYQQGFRLISFIDIDDVEYNSKDITNDEVSKVQEEEPNDTSA